MTFQSIFYKYLPLPKSFTMRRLLNNHILDLGFIPESWPETRIHKLYTFSKVGIIVCDNVSPFVFQCSNKINTEQCIDN